MAKISVSGSVFDVWWTDEDAERCADIEGIEGDVYGGYASYTINWGEMCFTAMAIDGGSEEMDNAVAVASCILEWGLNALPSRSKKFSMPKGGR